MPPSNRPHRRVELPTLAVAVAIYTGWLALTWAYHALPAWLIGPAGGWLLAWHGSLQHEAVHGHPTGRRWIDAAIAGPPLGLWLPFPLYRDSHLAHHQVATLTCPLEDPESYYLTAEAWRRTPAPVRAVRWAMQSALGRLVLGPPVVVARLLLVELPLVVRGDRRRLAIWTVHAVACAAVLGWVVGVCRVPLTGYLLLFVYPGLALTLLRSFAEHRPGADQQRRTAIVESGPILSLLYLNNNLHLVHHRAPGLPWYQIPRRFREQRAALLADNGDFHFTGYRAVLRRHALSIKDAPVHPGGGP
jgi:fatty acid desaturase